jgi:hypothetical protein
MTYEPYSGERKMGYFEKVEDFNPSEDDIDYYIERLEQYFIANEIPEVTEDGGEARRQAILLSCMGKQG